MICWDFIKNSKIEDVVDLQEKLFKSVRTYGEQETQKTHYLILTEHTPCFSYADDDDLSNIRISPEEFVKVTEVVPIRKYSRGGGITYHGPGQLTAYFVIAPFQFGIKGPKEFGITVDRVIKLLLALYYNLKAHDLNDLYALSKNNIAIKKQLASLSILSEKETATSHANGTWVLDNELIKKIASRGIRIRGDAIRGIFTFGCSINISTDLYYFNNIIKACGLDITATSIKEQTGIDMDAENTAYYFAKTFAVSVGEALRKTSLL